MTFLRQPGALKPRDVLAIAYAAKSPDGACAVMCSCGCTDAETTWNAVLDGLLDHRLFHSITEGVA